MCLIQAWCFIAIISIVPFGQAAFTCTTPKKNDSAPHFPPVVGNSYQAHIEVNLIDKNETQEVEEYLDYTGNRATRITHSGGTTTRVVYSYDTDEVFVIKDKSCQTINMSSDAALPYLYHAGSKEIPSDKRKAFGVVVLLRDAVSNSDFYLGQTTVRGIKVNQWSLCMPNYTLVTYSFNDPSWSMATKNTILPVRIEVQGQRNNTDGTQHNFRHIYDFIDYESTITADPSIFQTPTDVVCLGRESTKKLPTFPKRFQYTAESIDPTLHVVKHFSVWYDEEGMMFRLDKRDILAEAPLYTTNPVTEIHDFTTGVRYIKDRVMGNCSVYPLSASSKDSVVDPNQTIRMSDPSRFFSLNQGYAYMGKRMIRGMQCDVYSTVISDFNLDGIHVKANFHYYFLADHWDDFPLQDSTQDVKRYPVHLEIVPIGNIGIKYIFNFFDFDESPLNIDIFDVSDCFDDANKLGFRVTFPGKYNPSTEDAWKYFAHFKMASLIPISPLRIGGLEISQDLYNVFVDGFFLGTKPFDEFQLVAKNTKERIMKKQFFSVHLPQDCAALCVKNNDFTCNGFLYCPDSGYSCGLNQWHSLNQTVKAGGKLCDFFTRTILKTRVVEPSLAEAYSSLQTKIKSKAFNLIIEGPGRLGSDFTAIRLQETSGPSQKTKPLPSISSQFSYRLELVIPNAKTSIESYVWYDKTLQLVRLDKRSVEGALQHYEYSKIYDFNQGVVYIINKVSTECMIKPIPNDDAFDVDKVSSKADKYAGLEIKMKSPLQMFYMDDTYKYIGQKTVRGILCDGYQVKRSDYHLVELEYTSENSVFTLYFQADKWKYYTADSMDVTSTQPVQITIEDVTVNVVLIYNFYDFDDERHNFKYFDVSTCYTSDEKKTFEIVFKNQPIHPYLDTTEPTFQNTITTELGKATHSSPLRFQKVSVYSDGNDIYYMATVLGKVPPQYLFQPVTSVNVNPKQKMLVVSSLQDCANECANPEKPCNSFDYCPDKTSPRCSLLTLRDEFPQSGIVEANGTCIHYSRSEQGGYQMYTVEKMYLLISDYIFDNLLSVFIYLPSGKNHTYFATDVRDDLVQPSDPSGEAGSVLAQFTVTKNRKFPDSAVSEVHDQISVSDCALLCTSTTSLRCQSFDYDYNHGICRLSTKHLDEITPPPLKFNKLVNVYTTLYTRDYNKEGMVFPNNPDKTVYKVASSELCARNCDEESTFTCESFDYCPADKSCYLRKLHNLPKDNSTHSGNVPVCRHFSRNHLYDFKKQSNTIIVGNDDFVTTVTTAAECAQHCANGELNNCASFEVCNIKGETECRLSLADPTLQLNLTKQTSRECNLFVRSNPLKNIKPNVTPAGNKGTTPSNTNCNVNAGSQKQTSSSAEIDKRVGIAVGTLFMGLFMGALGMYLFSKWYRKNKTNPYHDDTHQLSDYSTPTNT